MRDEIKRRFENQIAAARKTSVHHAPGQDMERHAENLTTHVKATLASQVPAQQEELAPVPRAASATHRAQMMRLLDDWSSTGLVRSLKTYDLVVPTGSTVFAPPYDSEWQEGRGLAFGAKADGKLVTWDPMPGTTSGAGIGVSLNVTSPAVVSITPQGTYEFSWFSFEDIPGGWTKGGLGATVFQNADPTPILSEMATLWSVGNITKFTADSRNGTLASAVVAGPSGIFGTQFYAPINLVLQPGSSFLVWIWGWQLSNIPDGHAFMAIMNMTVPFISLTSGPPPIIH
jgi:hypothetical protein